MATAIIGELATRVDAIASHAAARPIGDVARDLDAIRRLAAASGHHPVFAVAHALEAAMARGERGALVRDWLNVLGEALGSVRTDPAAGDTFGAACSVRFSG